MLSLILLVFAFVCFALSFYFGDMPYRKLVSAGLAFWVFSEIITRGIR